MLMFMIQRTLCPIIGALVGSFETPREDFIVSVSVKFGVSLARVCFVAMSSQQRFEVNQALGHVFFRVPKTSVIDAIDYETTSVYDVIANPQLPWISGFAGSDFFRESENIFNQLFVLNPPPLLSASTSDILDGTIFIPEDQWAVHGSHKYADIARGIGRVIGYSIQSGYDLSLLSLQPEVVFLLWDPKSLGHFEDDDSFLFQTSKPVSIDSLLRTIHFVREGLQDTLGPMGPQMFTREEFTNCFNSS